MAADRGRVVGRVFFVRLLKPPGQRLRLRCQFRAHLKLDVDVRLGALLFAHRTIRPRHPVVEEHHVVLDHAEPFRLRVAARPRWILFALKRLSLRDVRGTAVQSRLLVVPERESNRSIGQHIWIAEDARELHHERRARAVVVGRLAPPVAVHVTGDDVHLVGARAAHLRTVHLFARAVGGRLHIECAELFVGLPIRVSVHTGARANPSRPAPARGDGERLQDVVGADDAWRRRGLGRRRRLVLIFETFDVRAAVAFEPRLNPVNRGAIAIGSLTPIAEGGQALDCRFVLFEIESLYQWPDQIGRVLCLRGTAAALRCDDWHEPRRDDASGRDDRVQAHLAVSVTRAPCRPLPRNNPARSRAST